MSKTKPGKIIHLAVFLAGLLVLVYGLTGGLDLPTGDSGIWFHSGLLLIAFGVYWIEYRFTKPDDVVINGLIVFVSISILNTPPHPEWWTALRYGALALVVTAFAISWHGSPALAQTQPSNLKRLLYLLVIRLGNASVIFSAVFLLALISYFDLKQTETKWMLVFWAALVVARHLELEEFARWLLSLRKAKFQSHIGQVMKFSEPNIVRFALQDSATCRRGSLIFVSTKGVLENDTPIGIVMGFRHDPNTVEGEALIVDSTFLSGAHDRRHLIFPIDPTDPALSERCGQNQLFVKHDKIVGTARHGSDISRLYFEMMIPPNSIEEGHLVYVQTSSAANVYFQIINGKLHEERSIEESERSYTVGEAEQLGTWNPTQQGFSTYSWVVKENSAVLHVHADEGADVRPADGILDIGRVPNSNFPVVTKIPDLILYHSAILGVTGSGKTFLAYHLIESAAQQGVKVICLDATGDYKRYIRGAVTLRNLKAVKTFMDDQRHPIGIVEFTEETTHPIVATTKISQLALKWCQENRTETEIRNPTAKMLVVLEEAHTLIPEFNFNPDKTHQNMVSTTAQVVLQARKYGLGFMVITQRTANVTKSILNQCNSIFAFQAYDETGFDFMRNYMGDHYVRALPNLKRQHGVLVGKASGSDRPIIARYHDQNREIVQNCLDYVPAAPEAPIGEAHDREDLLE